MSIIRDVVMSASVAVGNVASRERDRDQETTHEDGRPKALGERARERMQVFVREGIGKVVVAQTAHFGARELAKRVGNETLRKVFGQLAKRPIVSAGAALFAFDTARDALRMARGNIDGREFAQRVGGNTVGLVGSAGGAYVGSVVGTFAMPVVGTMVGSVIGGVIGGIGGDTYGRAQINAMMGIDEDDDVDDDVDEDDEDDNHRA
jgi:phage tail tape-measure protein